MLEAVKVPIHVAACDNGMSGTVAFLARHLQQPTAQLAVFEQALMPCLNQQVYKQQLHWLFPNLYQLNKTQSQYCLINI